MNTIQFRIKRDYYNIASFLGTCKCSFNYDLLARLVWFHFRVNLCVKQTVTSSWLPIKRVHSVNERSWRREVWQRCHYANLQNTFDKTLFRTCSFLSTFLQLRTGVCVWDILCHVKDGNNCFAFSELSSNFRDERGFHKKFLYKGIWL